MTALQAAVNLLAKGPGRWRHLGYGRANCTSCGAQRDIDYGDNNQKMRETREKCSPSCPWRLAEEAVEAAAEGRDLDLIAQSLDEWARLILGTDDREQLNQIARDMKVNAKALKSCDVG